MIKEFEENGFVTIPDFLSYEECDAMIAEAEALVDAFEPESVKAIFSTKEQEKTSEAYFLESGDEVRFFFEPKAFNETGELKQAKGLSINKIGHALHSQNPVFSRITHKSEFLSLYQKLNFRDPKPIQSMYIFKQPRIGGEVVCHQDATFLYTEPLSVTGFWFALQDATVENGCMYALPGGHRTPLRRRFRRTAEGSSQRVVFEELDSSPWPETGYVPLEAKKGSLILLHGLLPHLSGPNLSDLSRHAYTLHVIEGNAVYPADNWLRITP